MLGSAVHFHTRHASSFARVMPVRGRTDLLQLGGARRTRAAKQTAAAAAIAVASIAIAAFPPMVIVAPAAAAAAAVKANAKVELGCAVQARCGIIRKCLDDGVVDDARSVVKERVRALRPSTYSAARVHGTSNDSTRSNKRIINKQTHKAKQSRPKGNRYKGHQGWYQFIQTLACPY